VQTLTEGAFNLEPPGGVFDDAVVRNFFPELSPGARKLMVHRAVRHGEVLGLKPGLYCLAEEYRKTHPHPFVVAGALHSPSHISLESALSYHGLIPEAVHVTTSVTSRRSRSFTTPLWHFTFLRIPANQPSAGVVSVKVDSIGWAFIAGAVRAIADLVYSKRGVSWATDGLGFLTESMRIDEGDLLAISLDDIDNVRDSSRSRRVRGYLDGLEQEIGG